METIKRNGKPTSRTVGEIGQRYVDLDTNQEYTCMSINPCVVGLNLGEIHYTWKPVINSKLIPSSVTSWNNLTDKPFEVNTVNYPETKFFEGEIFTAAAGGGVTIKAGEDGFFQFMPGRQYKITVNGIEHITTVDNPPYSLDFDPVLITADEEEISINIWVDWSDDSAPVSIVGMAYTETKVKTLDPVFLPAEAAKYVLNTEGNPKYIAIPDGYDGVNYAYMEDFEGGNTKLLTENSMLSAAQFPEGYPSENEIYLEFSHMDFESNPEAYPYMGKSGTAEEYVEYWMLGECDITPEGVANMRPNNEVDFTVLNRDVENGIIEFTFENDAYPWWHGNMRLAAMYDTNWMYDEESGESFELPRGIYMTNVRSVTNGDTISTFEHSFDLWSSAIFPIAEKFLPKNVLEAIGGSGLPVYTADDLTDDVKFELAKNMTPHVIRNVRLPDFECGDVTGSVSNTYVYYYALSTEEHEDIYNCGDMIPAGIVAESSSREAWSIELTDEQIQEIITAWGG